MQFVIDRATPRMLLSIAALAAIVVFGALLRFNNLNWDDGHHLHPDERFMTMVGTAIELPSSVSEYFDTRTSPLNPYNRGYNSFVYGTFPLFLVRALAEPLNAGGYDKIHLLGRAISAWHDLGTIVIVFLIGSLLYGRRVGLLAALLLSASALHIQQAHFFTVDAYLTFYLVAAFYCTLRALRSGGPAWYGLAGVALGLATASKINALIFLAVPAAAVAMRWIKPSGGGERPPSLSPIAGSTLLGLVALAVFRLAQPYAFAGPSVVDLLPNPAWVNDLSTWQRLASGQADYPPSHQWAFTEPYIFPLRHMVLWGLGLPLGIAAMAGVGLTATLSLRSWSAFSRHALVLTWIGVNFAYWGGQMGKTMRYFLPIYPFLALLAAFALIWLMERAWSGDRERASREPSGASRARQRPLRLASLLALGIVSLGTVFYGLAFSTIYTRPVTRVAASEWIYENLPSGAPFAWEHWDDPLPLRLPGRDPNVFKSHQLTLYDEDTPEKRQKLLATLDQVDYIFLSSNRLYGSIPRLPMRYPMTTEYYRLLFSGELGFRLEKSFTSHPTLFGISINDDAAEEAFTVYDHPKVLIFRKTETYSSERARELLSVVDLSQVVRLRPVQAPQNGLLLTDEQRAIQEAGGTWSEIFDRGSLSNSAPLLVWLLAVEAIALAAYPAVWRLLGGLADRGFLVAKMLGLLGVGYLAWLLASVQALSFSRGSILLGLGLLAAGSAVLVWSRRALFMAFLRARWKVLALGEAVFLAAFAGFTLIRMQNPDLWHSHFGGEKPMDFAYLNAIVKSSMFPPYDPWFAGGYINYYYFGHVLTATLVKLTGVVPWVAYNLALPTYFGLTVALAYSFGFSFLAGQGRRARWPGWAPVACGLLAALLVAVVGNLDALAQVAESLGKMGGANFQSRLPLLAGAINALIGLRALLAGQSLPPVDFWRSTRVIGPEDPGPISEFPYFTFLYGDLHAHLIALPITLAAILLGLNLIRLARSARLVPEWRLEEGGVVLARRLIVSPWPWLVLLSGWVVGALRPANTWDYPTYLVLMAAVFGLVHFQQRRRLDVGVVAWTASAVAGLGAISTLLFQPFTRHYALFYTGVEPVRHTTALNQYLTIFGAFFLLLGGLLAVETWLAWRAAARLAAHGGVPAEQYHAGPPAPAWLERFQAWVLPSMGLVFVGAVFYALGLATAAFIAVGLGLIAFHALRPGRSLDLRFVLLLAGLALCLTLVPEFVALQGDIGRMNTVFKFYLQAWVMLALAAAVAVPYVSRRLTALAGSGSSALRWWWVLVSFVILAGLLYPLFASQTKLGQRFVQIPPTLDGMAYMRSAVYHDAGKQIPLADDYEAINWMLDQVQGSPTIVEAVTPLYRWGGRVSVYTGLPTVLGWDWHQKQQRGDFGYMVDERVQQVKQFYETPSVDQARQFLRRYGVGYVYVGPLERAYYSPQGLAKFDAMVGGDLTIAYQNASVTIYAVVSK